MIRYGGSFYLGWGTASLKFRQFNSAVCDAFGGYLYMYRISAYTRGYANLYMMLGWGLLGFDMI